MGTTTRASVRPDVSAAETFLWLNARLIDRHRYLFHFKAGSSELVLAALRPYQNADGGFGNALEPDLRGPASQPVPVEVAFHVLDEIDGFADRMVGRACAFLESVSTSEGGVPFVLPSALEYPRGPWWQTTDRPSASLNPTAAIAGLLHKHRVTHPWVDRATEFVWRSIEGNYVPRDPYEVRCVLTFLDHVRDRERAESGFVQVGRTLIGRGLIELDPSAPGEVHIPLDVAPTPAAMARRLFADDVIDAHLEALAAAQQQDGGWLVNWKIWTPATGLEWRAWATVRALLILRAYGRLT